MWSAGEVLCERGKRRGETIGIVLNKDPHMGEEALAGLAGLEVQRVKLKCSLRPF